MIMTIEVSAMTGRTALATGSTDRTAGQSAGSGCMTGGTTAAAMGIGSTGIRSTGCYGMTVNTQGHRVHAMAMVMIIKVSRMTR